MGQRTVTVIGGGIAGLVASIAAAEGGATVTLHEAHSVLGGRARSTTGAFLANHGPHAIYADGDFWAWLEERKLTPPVARAHLRGLRFRAGGRARRVPPASAVRALALLRHDAPDDVDLRTWAAGRAGDEVAATLAAYCGVFTFDHDPGRLSAAFCVERARRASKMPPSARFPVGGWTSLIDVLAARARELGVHIELNSRVDHLPPAPVIVATELRAARRLLGDETIRSTGTRTMLLDVGLVKDRRDPSIVSDLDEAGWIERFSAQDPSLAPAGHSLLQAQLGARDDESLDEALIRIERLFDETVTGWREREVWRRRQLVTNSSGALDLPGTTWRDRPAVDRGDGVFLAGDMVAAPGLLAEVAWASAVEAASLAIRVPAVQGKTHADTASKAPLQEIRSA
jgi:phytoene dehydrogenase-like protein